MAGICWSGSFAVAVRFAGLNSGGFLMNGNSRIVAIGAGLASVLLLGVGPSWAGACAVPAPLIGVTGPYGIVAAGVAYGGYYLFRRYRNRS
jgi:hypothetical protein